MQQYGVSRTVIREAISSLRVDGLVQTRQGRGVFVAKDISRQPFRLSGRDLSERDHLEQVMELRLHMDVANATRNPYLADFLRFPGQVIIPANAMHEMDEGELPKYQESLRAEHSTIANAISDRERAQRLTR